MQGLAVSLSLFLPVSVRTAHPLLGVGGVCLFIRSEGLQVAERTRLITSSETGREGAIDREMGEIGGAGRELEGRKG